MFKCHELGRIAANYPNPKVITLAEWDVVKDDIMEEEKEEDIESNNEEEQEVIKEADEGEMLVLRRALSSQRSEKEEHRENIFHSRCTVQGKVCSLIINGGSCAKVVSLSTLKN